MSTAAHINQLQAKHDQLKQVIKREMLCPSSSDIMLHRLKKQKLYLKDMITRLHRSAAA